MSDALAFIPSAPLAWVGVLRPGMNERLIVNDAYGDTWFVSFERALELRLFELPSSDPDARDYYKYRSECRAAVHARWKVEGINPGQGYLPLENAIPSTDGRGHLIPPRSKGARHA